MAKTSDEMVRVRGAREHNLKNVDVDIPRDALVVFTGVSGSGKSSLAFGTLFAEAQRRYLESVAPYARRLFNQIGAPDVDSIDGLPPAIALQQQRGSATTRSSVGSVTTISNLLRMLYSRAGDYPKGQPLLYAESFSPNTPEGACPKCHGLGRVYEVTEKSMVPDDSLTIRERAIAAWPTAWHGQNLRDVITTLGYDVDKPWRELSRKDREWLLFTEEQPSVPVYPRLNRIEVQQAIRDKKAPDYMGTFTGARRYVMETFAKTESASMKKRVGKFMVSADCSLCQGKRLGIESLSVKFSGFDIAEISSLPLKQLCELLRPFASSSPTSTISGKQDHPEKLLVLQRIAADLTARLEVINDLGLGYLSLDRTTPTLSPGELQRLRLATQVQSNLFGVVYVLDEPSAGLHPADTEALLRTFEKLKAAGNSLFIVEHEIEIIRRADWIVDVGPAAGERGGEILYSGPLAGFEKIKDSQTSRYVFGNNDGFHINSRTPKAWLKLKDVSRNNLENLQVAFPLGTFTTVTGVSGSGKSSLVSQVLVELVLKELGQKVSVENEPGEEFETATLQNFQGAIVDGLHGIKRVVQVDQRAIGRTPRSNLATYTGFFDQVRRLFAETNMAKRRHYDAGRFSFNVAKGRCETCQGEGWIFVELLFMPGVYSPCPSCHGSRYNSKTLEILYNGKNIAAVLAMTVEESRDFFESEASLQRPLEVLMQLGLGYLRLGQPATELSGGEAQRIKLATELQRMSRGETLYILDEPTTGLHPSDVAKMMIQLNNLVDAGNTVIVVEHDMQVASSSDWIIDMGPGAGEEGGKIVAQGRPHEICGIKGSRTAPYLRAYTDK